ncbi:DUF3500 domain-containing protein [uncultured Imperialibacter sp.]|uniref:DUF3500 domain-containing protein n=1 Tax=uncultured Imperialibacter sp. TaxID=1672639 RepID=UPI0030D81C77|tara:strand:- start:885 stop:1952 length:1068 start_codon:yes stop_codon:yes gene_type:complete
MKYLLTFITFLTLTSSTLLSQSAQEIVDVTKIFLKTLNAEDLQQISLPFDDPDREKWTNLPVGLVPRPGKRYGDLSEESMIQFHRVLTTLFSSQGYLKITSIMQLDDILNIVYDTSFERGTISKEGLAQIKKLDWEYGNYFVSLWGTPDMKEPWGLNMGGHHMAVSLSMADGKYSLTPLFFGSDPAEVRITKYAGLRVLSKEEDYGFLLINALTEQQKKTATLSQKVPGDIITSPNGPKRIDDYYGIKAADMNKEQKGLLEWLIKEYVDNLEHGGATRAYDKLVETGIDNIYFAWIGSYEARNPHYYIINGPDFMIEYDNVGFDNDGNHIHAIWREKSGDFGEDILKAHYLGHKH